MDDIHPKIAAFLRPFGEWLEYKLMQGSYQLSVADMETAAYRLYAAPGDAINALLMLEHFCCVFHQRRSGHHPRDLNGTYVIHPDGSQESYLVNRDRLKELIAEPVEAKTIDGKGIASRFDVSESTVKRWRASSWFPKPIGVAQNRAHLFDWRAVLKAVADHEGKTPLDP